jgi:hypothetical protein
VQDEDAEMRLLALAAELLHRGLDVLFELAHRVLERRARIVHLVDNQDVLANQVRHLEGREVQPLRARYFCAGRFNVWVAGGAELFVQGEADGLDGDVGCAGFLEEGARRELKSAGGYEGEGVSEVP